MGVTSSWGHEPADTLACHFFLGAPKKEAMDIWPFLAATLAFLAAAVLAAVLTTLLGEI